MKNALKLNKNQLFILYEKSNDRIKEQLRSEFGQEYFVKEKVGNEVTAETRVSSTNSEIQKSNTKKSFD